MLLGRLSSQAKNLSRNHRQLLVVNNNSFNNLKLVGGLRSASTFYERCKTRLFELMSVYEEIIGIKEVKQAQDSVQQVSIPYLNLNIIFDLNLILLFICLRLKNRLHKFKINVVNSTRISSMRS